MIGVILAAGKGTRLAPYTHAVAKEMLPIGEIPVIEYNVRYLAKSGVEKIYVVLSDGKEQIVRYLRNGERYGVDIAYLYQDMSKTTGTAAAILPARPWVDDSFIVSYADAFFHPGDFIPQMLDYHKAKRAVATMGLYPLKAFRNYGVVKTNQDGVFMDLLEKPTPEEAKAYKQNDFYLVFSGPLIFGPQVFRYIETTPVSKRGEIEITDTILLMKEDDLGIYGYPISEKVFWRDVGTPQARLEAEEYALRELTNTT